MGGAQGKDGGQRYLLAIWIIAGVSTPLLGWLGARGFAPLLGLLGFLSLGYLRDLPRRREDWPLLAVFVLMLAWMTVSCLWSPAPNLVVHTGKDFSRLTTLHLFQQLILSGAFLMGAGALQAQTARRAMAWLSGGFVLLAALLMAEGFTQAAMFLKIQQLTHNKDMWAEKAAVNVSQGSYVLVALLWPLCAALYAMKRTLVGVFLALAVVISTFTLHGDAPTMALGASAVVFLAVLAFGRAAVMAVMGLSTIYWSATPAAMLMLQKNGVFANLYDKVQISWARRTDIWEFAARLWLNHPLRGLGMDSSRAFKGFIPLHPHNGALQIWLELGLPGALLMIALWILLFWRIAGAGAGRLFMAAATAAAVVYLVIGAVSFGLWQEWWVCVGVLSLAACVALRKILGQAAGKTAAAAG